MRVRDISVKEAEGFLARAGAHYKTESEPICAMAAEDDGMTRGVVILGRVSEGVADICHIYSDGSPQVFTTLYGQTVRVLKALGYSMMALDKL